MVRQRRIKEFLNNPNHRDLLTHLFLKHGRAYRMKERAISTGKLTSKELEGLLACGFVENGKGGYALTRLGRVIGYGLLEYHEFNKRKKIAPKLWKNTDIPIPEETWVKGKVLVDIGCGSGAFVNSAVHAQAKLAFGIDLQTNLLKLAQVMDGSHKAFFMNARTDALPLPSGIGEIIFLRGVLPYVHNERTLAEVARISAPGAELFIRTLGPGYYLKAAQDAAKNLKILHFIYVLLVLINGAIHYLLQTRIPIYLKKFDFSELLSIFNTQKKLAKSLARFGFSTKDEKTQKELGMPAYIFLWASKR